MHQILGMMLVSVILLAGFGIAFLVQSKLDKKDKKSCSLQKVTR